MNEQIGHPMVRGRCPSCGAESLFLGTGGYVTCAVIGCRSPAAASDLLMDSEPVIRDKPGQTVTGALGPAASHARMEAT